MPSEIRESTIRDLEDRARHDRYAKYLKTMTIIKLRSFDDAFIRFDFPVTALIGPNGSGKTTILGAAGLIYKTVAPRRFFAKSGKYDNSMQNWRIEYAVLDTPTSGRQRLGQQVIRTASYLRAKWNQDALDRQVIVIGINRTLPASERRDLYKFVGSDFIGDKESVLDDAVVDAVKKILGKDADKYLSVSTKSASANIFAVRDDDNPDEGYSEFHFGAGEASVIRIVTQIEAAPHDSLLLIEEIENGLHPVAVRRLVEYLIEVAKRKSCQVIFTTHSNDALSPLPSDAVWSCYRGQLQQGKLDVETLRTLTGEIRCELAIFAEDAFGALVADVTLRKLASQGVIRLQSIEIHPTGGADPARDLTRFHNKNPTAHFPAIALIDGDMRARDDFIPQKIQTPLGEANDLCFAPGDSHPESTILSDVAENLTSEHNLLGKLTQRLTLDTAMQERVRRSIEQRRATNRDPHVIFDQIGEDLDFLPGSTVARAFISIWADAFPDKVRKMWADSINAFPGVDAATRQSPREGDN